MHQHYLRLHHFLEIFMTEQSNGHIPQFLKLEIRLAGAIAAFQALANKLL